MRIRTVDDLTLVEAVAAGDDGAAGELFRRHREAMFACALSVLRDPHDADDAVQTAMTKAIAAIARDRPRRLRPWLLAIVRNEALMLLRSRVPREPLDPNHPSPASVEGAVSLREEMSGLVLDLRGLPDRQRAAIVLRHLHELSYRDIGELLGVRPATARQAVLQARRSLLARAEARAQDCGDVRLLLSGDGRARRAVAVQAHLESCAACRAAVPAGIGARIRSLLPIPEPLVPALLLRLMSGPGAAIRTGGAAAACLCTVVIGLGLVDLGSRGGGDPPRPAVQIPASPPAGDGRRLVAERSARPVRGAERHVATPPSERAERVPVPAATATPAPAADAQPTRPAGQRDPGVPAVVPPEERRHYVTVEVLDETAVTVYGYDLENLPIIGEPPFDPPVGDPVPGDPPPLPPGP